MANTRKKARPLHYIELGAWTLQKTIHKHYRKTKDGYELDCLELEQVIDCMDALAKHKEVIEEAVRSTSTVDYSSISNEKLLETIGKLKSGHGIETKAQVIGLDEVISEPLIKPDAKEDE